MNCIRLAGAYVWTPVASGGSGTAFTGISVDNTGTGISVTGNGTDASKLKVSVNANGINTAQIANGAISAAKIQSAKADSGKILVANGTSAVWIHNGSPQYAVPVDSVKSISNLNLPVSWNKVLVATVTIARPSAGVYSVPLTGVKPTDMCVSSKYPHVYTSGANAVHLYWMRGPSTTFSEEITCYRPSV